MKPDTHVINIINAVSDTSRILHARERQIISLGHHAESMTFVLHKGTVMEAVYGNLEDVRLKRHRLREK